ncbi:TPA: hypothetical protein ACLIVI_004608 [Bacillus pacificus]|uniref:hypothetical protein n=1 Tax=Bacillus cereus group sp. BY2-1LC TaxID=3018081 RepID=UPI0022E39409|nr:hypothetical protein [Bacillus cereus group sp. BY2-1LC]MDA1824239.1 hypothetical protein [Bacillus cereus group sp. BY2-1LC]
MGYTFIFLLGWIIGLVTGLVEKINRKIKGECRLHKLVMMDGEFENYSLDEAQQKMNDMFQVVKMMNGKGCTIKFEFYDYKDKKPDDLFLEGDEE